MVIIPVGSTGQLENIRNQIVPIVNDFREKPDQRTINSNISKNCPLTRVYYNVDIWGSRYLCHSDRGREYANHAVGDMLKDLGIRQSMSGKGDGRGKNISSRAPIQAIFERHFNFSATQTAMTTPIWSYASLPINSSITLLNDIGILMSLSGRLRNTFSFIVRVDYTRVLVI